MMAVFEKAGGKSAKPRKILVTVAPAISAATWS